MAVNYEAEIEILSDSDDHDDHKQRKRAQVLNQKQDLTTRVVVLSSEIS